MLGNTRKARDLGLIFLGFVLLSIVRSPDALTTPMLYAEDGVWLTEGLSKGWHWAAFNARPDYPTLFHAVALSSAATLSLLFSGNALWLAAFFTACIGYGIWAGVATYMYSIFRGFADRTASLLVAVGFIFIPMGSTSNETMGRVLQIGFLVPVLLTLVFLGGNTGSTYVRIARALFVFGLALTSPVVIPIWCAWHLVEQFRNLKNKTRLDIVNNVLFIAMVIIGANIWLRPKVPTAIPGGLKMDSILETILARSLLYPGTATIYKYLTDGIAIILAITIASLLLMLLVKKKTRSISAARVLPITYVWLAYMLITMTTRPGLTEFMANYTNTYPDRYFLGLNTISWMLVSAIALLIGKAAVQGKVAQTLSKAGKILLALLVTVNIAYSTEILGTRLDISHGKSWQNRLCSAQPTEAIHGQKVVAIEPAPDWNVLVNANLVDQLPCN